MIPSFTLLVTVVFYRIVAGYGGTENSWWLNFSPVAAIALCGPLVFPRRVALLLPLAGLLVSDIMLNLHFGAALFTGEKIMRYLALTLVAWLGLRLRECRHVGVFLLASVAGSTSFYLITNTASWFTDTAYAKTLAGWIQALTLGLPGYPPTWLFFRNSLVSDACFTLAFFGCFALSTTSKSVSQDFIKTTPLIIRTPAE
jgi:hypothetical protein